LEKYFFLGKINFLENKKIDKKCFGKIHFWGKNLKKWKNKTFFGQNGPDGTPYYRQSTVSSDICRINT
jgi:hypothetical protein